MWIKILVPLHLLSNFEIINYLNYKARLNGFFLKKQTNIEDKKVKKGIGFYYLLTEIQLYTLILLELNKFL